MSQLDPMLSELRGRLERLGYVVVPHGDHLCVRLPLLTSVRVRRGADGQLTFVPQFGPFRRSGGLFATSGVSSAAVTAVAITAGIGPVMAVVAFLGVVALAHDACRFVLTEGAVTRLQLLATEAGALAPGTAAAALPAPPPERPRLPGREATLPLLLLAVQLAGCTRGTAEAPGSDDSATAVAVVPDSLGRRPEDAAAAVRSYLASLSQRDYARAASLWAENATDGAGDSAAFRRAHGDTAIVRFDVGVPGRVEGAAGSRYVTVPVVVDAATPERPPLLLHGIVTLRRSVVDGASDAQRRWRIAGIEWSTSGKPAQPPR